MGLGASLPVLDVYDEDGFMGFVARREHAGARWYLAALLDASGRAHRVQGQGIYDLPAAAMTDPNERVVNWGSFAGQTLWLRRLRIAADESIEFMLSHGRWSCACTDTGIYLPPVTQCLSGLEIDAGVGQKLLSFRVDVGVTAVVSNVLTKRVPACQILPLASAPGGFRGVIVDAATRTHFWGLVAENGQRHLASWALPEPAIILEGPTPASRLVALRLSLDHVHCVYDTSKTEHLCLPPPIVAACRHNDEHNATFVDTLALELDGVCELTSIALELDQTLGLRATVSIFSPPSLRGRHQMSPVTALTIHPSVHSAPGFWGYQMYASGAFAGLLGEGSSSDPMCKQVRFLRDGRLMGVRINAAQKFMELVTCKQEKIRLPFLTDHAYGKVARVDHVVHVAASLPLVITKFGITYTDSTRRDISIFMEQDHAAAPRMSGEQPSTSTGPRDAVHDERPSYWVYFGLFLIIVAVLGMLAIGWHTTRKQKHQNKIKTNVDNERV